MGRGRPKGTGLVNKKREALNLYRRTKGEMKQAAIARRLGVTQQTVSGWIQEWLNSLN